MNLKPTLLIALLLAPLAALQAADALARKPNIFVILVDDLGWIRQMARLPDCRRLPALAS